MDILGFSLDGARPWSGCGYGLDTDWTKIRIVRGRGLDMVTDKSWSRSGRGLDAGTERTWSRSRCGLGLTADADADWPRKRARSIYGHDPGLDTDMVTDKIRSRTDRDHGWLRSRSRSGRGLCADTDMLRSGHGLDMTTDIMPDTGADTSGQTATNSRTTEP